MPTIGLLILGRELDGLILLLAVCD